MIWVLYFFLYLLAGFLILTASYVVFGNETGDTEAIEYFIVLAWPLYLLLWFVVGVFIGPIYGARRFAKWIKKF